MFSRWIKPVPLLITLTVVVVVCFLRIMSLPQFFPDFRMIQTIEDHTYDWRMKELFDRQAAPPNLAAIFIDDESLKLINDKYEYAWPLPRQLYGRIVRELNAQGAKAIGFDILFAERHARAPNTDVALRDGRTIGSDEFFAQEIAAASGKVILGVMGQKQMTNNQVLWEAFVPAPVFTNGARLGHIISEADDDGVLRRAICYREATIGAQPGRYWSMAVVLAAIELGLDLDKAEVQPDRVVLTGPGGARRIVPLDHEHSFQINWSMTWNDWRLAKHSIEDVLDMDKNRQAGRTNFVPVFKDKLVVVGSLGTGNNLSDRGATSVDRQTFLVSKHWNVASQIILNRFIQPCPLWLELALILLMALVGALLTWHVRAWLATPCVVGVIFVYLQVARLLFVDHLFWLPIIIPCGTALLSCHFAVMTYRVLIEQREKRRIKGVFSKVVSPDVVKELLDAEHLELGGAQRRITIFFADVRGFTDLTDSAQARADEHIRARNLTGQAATDYQDEQARELLGTVNLYLSTVAGVIKAHGGTLDKYIGDCVMAFWGAPIANEKHALSCVRAAIAAQLAIYRLNLEREQENRRREQENEQRAAAKLPLLPIHSLLHLGSGINTGVVTVGLMGSEDHLFNYTVFGREVNLASRLEGVSGRSRVIIGEATYEDLKRDDPALAAACVPQTPLPVKGFRKPVQVYEVPWKPPERPAPVAAAPA